MNRFKVRSLMAAATLALAACGGSHMGNQMATNSTGATAGGALMSVSPAGNSSGVSPSTLLVLRFSHAMAPGMEQYVDLHEGDTSGPTVPMSCGWSPDRTVLTCQPSVALKAHTTYMIHMGDGMMDSDDHPVSMDAGLAMGGQWLMAGMMGGLHAGSPMGMMGAGWHGANGSYGMVFAFTTA